jgi:hypothetical protein
VVEVQDTAVLELLVDQVEVALVEDHQIILALLEHQALEVVAVEEDILALTPLITVMVHMEVLVL